MNDDAFACASRWVPTKLHNTKHSSSVVLFSCIMIIRLANIHWNDCLVSFFFFSFYSMLFKNYLFFWFKMKSYGKAPRLEITTLYKVNKNPRWIVCVFHFCHFQFGFVHVYLIRPMSANISHEHRLSNITPNA